MLKLRNNYKYEGKMDEEIVELCNALNALPGIYTIESCSGHGEKPIQIWFKCDGDMEGLFFITRCVDNRYFKYGRNWMISLEVADTMRDDGILPTIFMLKSVDEFTAEITKGEEAYKQANEIVKNMNNHLNCNGFVKGFSLNLNKFEIEK